MYRLSGHSKIDKTKILKKNCSLMKVESIAECSIEAFCNTFDLHLAIIGLKTNFCLLFEWPLKTGFTVYKNVNDERLDHKIETRQLMKLVKD